MINGYASAASVRYDARRAVETRLLLAGFPEGQGELAPGATLAAIVEKLAGALAEEARAVDPAQSSAQLGDVAGLIHQTHPRVGAAAVAEAFCALPGYRAWVKGRIEALRTEGKLATDVQYADMSAGRRLQVGDRARYVGPTRMEPVAAPGGHPARHVWRPTGQVGRIVRVNRVGRRQRADKVFEDILEIHFMPHIDPNARTAALEGAIDLELVELTVTDDPEGGYFTLERIVEAP